MTYDCTVGFIFVGNRPVIALDMARKKTSFRLDERILDAISQASKTTGHSRNGWLEHHLFEMLKEKGFIPTDAEPLGETRGGDRTSTTDEATA